MRMPVISKQQVLAAELLVAPRGVRHRPVAGEETHLVLLEPHQTVNTGDAELAGTVGEWLV